MEYGLAFIFALASFSVMTKRYQVVLGSAVSAILGIALSRSCSVESSGLGRCELMILVGLLTTNLGLIAGGAWQKVVSRNGR